MSGGTWSQLGGSAMPRRLGSLPWQSFVFVEMLVVAVATVGALLPGVFESEAACLRFVKLTVIAVAMWWFATGLHRVGGTCSRALNSESACMSHRPHRVARSCVRLSQ